MKTKEDLKTGDNGYYDTHPFYNNFYKIMERDVEIRRRKVREEHGEEGN